MAQVVKNVTSWLNREAELALYDPSAAAHEFWEMFKPGGKLHPARAIENKYHLIIEALLIIGITWLLTRRRSPAKPSPETLTEQVRYRVCSSAVHWASPRNTCCGAAQLPRPREHTHTR
jgi:hypothetical protein